MIHIAGLPADPERCMACAAGAAAEPLYQVRGFTIVRCSACGLARTLVPPDFDAATIYTEAYFQGGHSDGYSDYQGSREILATEFRRTLRDIVAAGATGGKLLEIGCAYGFFLDEAKASFQVSGIELAKEAVDACQARGLDVVREASDQFYAARRPFDAVVMLDVIEHLPAPDRVLGELYRNTRSGSLLVVTTGDFGSFMARATGRRWRLMTPPQHLWFFTIDAITRLLERNGFHVVDSIHPWKQVPLNLIGYQLCRYLGWQSWLRNRRIPGSAPVNLFDAMRIVAKRS